MKKGNLFLLLFILAMAMAWGLFTGSFLQKMSLADKEGSLELSRDL
ncbi:hypothetical protein [Planococcus faecalis]|nr:hypothetical protein [Planococcus faecalis]